MALGGVLLTVISDKAAEGAEQDQTARRHADLALHFLKRHLRTAE